MIINGEPIEVKYTLKKAPSPGEIFWSNIGMTAWKVFLSRLGTYSLTMLIIGISLGILLALKYAQLKLTQNDTANTHLFSFSSSSIKVRGISLVMTLVVVVINSVLAYALRLLTKYEKHTSTSTFMRSLTLKISIVLVVVNLGTIYQHKSAHSCGSQCHYGSRRHSSIFSWSFAQ